MVSFHLLNVMKEVRGYFLSLKGAGSERGLHSFGGFSCSPLSCFFLHPEWWSTVQVLCAPLYEKGI